MFHGIGGVSGCIVWRKQFFETFDEFFVRSERNIVPSCYAVPDNFPNKLFLPECSISFCHERHDEHDLLVIIVIVFLVDCKENEGVLQKPSQVSSFASENFWQVQFGFLDGRCCFCHFVRSVKICKGVFSFKVKVLECVK